MKRKFMVTLTTETDDDFYLIKYDLEMEIDCCWHDFEIESVEEIDGRRIANGKGEDEQWKKT
jgi:hypothetical protein